MVERDGEIIARGYDQVADEYEALEWAEGRTRRARRAGAQALKGRLCLVSHRVCLGEVAVLTEARRAWPASTWASSYGFVGAPAIRPLPCSGLRWSDSRSWSPRACRARWGRRSAARPPS